MVVKQKTNTRFSKIKTWLTFVGIVGTGFLLRLGLFGLGLALIFTGFLSPDNTLLLSSTFVIVGLVLIVLGLLAGTAIKNITTKNAKAKPSTLHKQLVTFALIGGCIGALLIFVQGSLYWAPLAVNASAVKSKGAMTVGTTTEQDWAYPLALSTRGRSSSIKQASVVIVVDGQKYTTSTMVHLPRSSTGSVKMYYDPANPQNAVTFTLWSTAVLQAIIFGALTIITALCSGALVAMVIKDRDFFYAKPAKSK